MGNMLASDLNNPDYVGATNPDARLAVRFFSQPVQNEWESQRQGRPIFQDVDFVEIQVPGDTTSKIVQAVREDHKKRFPLHWAHYQNNKGGEESAVGTPLSQWQRITPAQAEELRALKFKTVESIAYASDSNLQSLKMIAGMSGYALRDHAKRFLSLAQEDAQAGQNEERAKKMEEENQALKDQLAKQAETLAEMQAAIAELAKPKRKYTKRKPKEEPAE